MKESIFMLQTERDHRLDNIKGIMIFFVVFAHAISNLYTGWRTNEVNRYLYYFIYCFHMPVFIFVSGYLSKRKSDYRTYLKKAISTCFIPYIVLNIISALPSHVGLMDLFSPRWTLWYLLSLFLWKLIVEIFLCIKWPLVVALLLSFYTGFNSDIDSTLSLSRTLCFFPFFLAGYLCSKDSLNKAKNLNKVFPTLAFAIIVVIAAILSRKGNTSIVYLSTGYHSLGQRFSEGIIWRSLVLLAGFSGILFFISTASNKKSVITDFGRYSVTVYLGHSFAIRILKRLSIININNTFMFIIFDIIFSLAVCFLFGNKQIAQVYHKIMDKISSLVVTKEHA